MPRFGIKAQISVLSLGLLSIPLVGLNYWDEIRKTTLTAQARIQEIEAKAIATSLLATQQNIRELLVADERSELQKHALPAPSIKQPIRLDGLFGDWPKQSNLSPRFNVDHPYWLADPDGQNESAFSLHLAQSSQFLYVAIDVRDDKVVFRKPSHLRLDYNDYVQLSYHDETGTLRRIILPAEKEGVVASYYTDEHWQHGRDIEPTENTARIASHKTNIQGYWHQSIDGYSIEFRIPTAKLNTLQPQIRVAIVDVDDKPSFGPQAIVASLPKRFEEQLNPVGLHARELQRVIDQLKNTYARLWIYDSRGREWAFAERDPQAGEAPTAFDTQCVRDALQNKPQPLRILDENEGQLNRLVVCYPIQEHVEVLGVVVIEESADIVLKKQEERMEILAMRVGGAIVLLLLILFTYAFNLVRRISRLSEEARKSIDPHGRIERTTINASRHFPDEIGDLSRGISTLLEKQQSYMHFLERIPQTLRHEIANPLNKLRTSVENLLEHKPELADDNYIRKIDAGIDQITQITLHLTEAASLESAIQKDILVKIDLNKFMAGYFSAWEGHIECGTWDQAPTWILGDSSRLEQLFDKLLDNASSFCPEEGTINVGMERTSDSVTITIENDGPLLPTENTVELFSPMISTRSSGANIHLGLGLHIAKLISDHHKAKLIGKNREDGTGVMFSVEFELVSKLTH